MKKIGMLTFVGLFPALAFGQVGLVKIGGEVLVKGGMERAVTQQASSVVTNGIRNGVLKGLEAPAATIPAQTAITRAVTTAMAGVPQTTLAPLAQSLPNTVFAAQKANQLFFNIPAFRTGYEMDVYPEGMLERVRETALIGAKELPLPLSSPELQLLAAADTKGEFFEVDTDLEKDDVVASFRQRMHVNVAPGSFMYHTRVGEILKIEKDKFAALQRSVQSWSAQEVATLKYRAGISYLSGGRKYLDYDEFRGLVSTGDSEFFGEPFLALVQKHNAPVSSVGVFFPVKKNLIVRSNFVFYSLPANSYVGIEEFNGAVNQSRFLFDAKPLMRPFQPEMIRQLEKSLLSTPEQKSVYVMDRMDGTAPLQP